MNKQVAIIFGSSRSHGNTRTIVETLKDNGVAVDVFDLNRYNIGYYSYEFKNANDDFISLYKELLNYNTLLFATPIYWYTMSAQMKTFFDRISDMLKGDNKPLGRLIRGKNMAVLSCGSGEEIFEGFTMPFEKSAEYLGMSYIGHIHTWVEDDSSITKEVVKSLKEFSDKL